MPLIEHKFSHKVKSLGNERLKTSSPTDTRDDPQKPEDELKSLLESYKINHPIQIVRHTQIMNNGPFYSAKPLRTSVNYLSPDRARTEFPTKPHTTYTAEDPSDTLPNVKVSPPRKKYSQLYPRLVNAEAFLAPLTENTMTLNDGSDSQDFDPEDGDLNSALTYAMDGKNMKPLSKIARRQRKALRTQQALEAEQEKDEIPSVRGKKIRRQNLKNIIDATKRKNPLFLRSHKKDIKKSPDNYDSPDKTKLSNGYHHFKSLGENDIPPRIQRIHSDFVLNPGSIGNNEDSKKNSKLCKNLYNGEHKVDIPKTTEPNSLTCLKMPNNEKGNRIRKSFLTNTKYEHLLSPLPPSKKKDSGIYSDSDMSGDEGEREVWSSKADFLLSIIGFAVDLSNIWRFPYLCYKNGGGAFLIPYTIMLLFGGMPLLYMELALGQYNKAGAVGIWKMVPILKGTGYAAILITFYVSFYYPVIIGYAFYYLFASFTRKLPWSKCDHPWNTPKCIEYRLNMTNLHLYAIKPNNITTEDKNSDSLMLPWYKFQHPLGFNHNNMTNFYNDGILHWDHLNYKTASEEFFERKVLAVQEGSGFHHITPIKWDVCLCTLLVYVITFFSLYKGVKTSGKVVWFTAIAPYILLTILLIQALLLPGSLNGITYYLTPQIDKIKSPQVWYEAAVQIFYSTGPGFGVHIAYASYNKFHNNIQTDVLITCAVNSLTSFFAGFVVFAFLGYMSLQRGLDIDRVAKDGPGLVFVVYPEALTILKGSVFFSIIFFVTLLTLGLDSLLGGMEAVLTGLRDDLEPWLKRVGISPKYLMGAVILVSFSVALLCNTRDGIYWVTFLDTYAAGTSLLFIVFFEAVGVTWIYGIDKFSHNVREMIGFTPNIFWRFCWKYISPSLILIMIISGLVLNEPLRYGDYIYPKWTAYCGWLLTMSSILIVPGYAAWKILETHIPSKSKLSPSAYKVL